MDLNRAYSLLTIRSVDEQTRTITGIATTPTPDRMGDIVEPKGIHFKNPLPLLLFHDSTRPVGTVTFDKPTDAGVTFEAKLVDPTKVTSAALKERLEEAWDSVRAKLVRGVSIGFRALEDGVEFMRDTGGLRFTETEVLELSLVTIPANADATIHTIKGLDRVQLASLGARAAVHSPVSSGTSRQVRSPNTMKTITERISDFRTEKAAKVARMNELTGANDGSTMDAAAQDEFDTLTSEVKALDSQIGRLETVDTMNKSMATEVKGGSPTEASLARAGATTVERQPVITVRQRRDPGIGFTRVVLCKAFSFLEMQKGNFVSALDVAKDRYRDDNEVHEFLKAAVPAGTTSNSVFVGPLIDPTNLANEFIEFLRPATIIGKFGTNGIPSLRRVPFNVRVIGQTSDAEGYWVGQGKPKPLTSFALEATTLTWAKIATITVLTEESVRFSSPSAELLARDAIVAAVVKRADIDFVDPDKSASSGVSPASITNGINPLSSAGPTADNIRTDLVNLLSEFVDADNPVSDIVLIMPSGLALATSMMVNTLGQDEFPNMTANGGRLRGLPVITSNYLGRFTGRGNILIAVNPSEIFLSDDGQVTVDVSREASLEMSDAPTQNGAAGAGASLVSMWQNNLVALRAERFINWARRRTTAVAWMDDITWGASGSPTVP